jgi:hypothetical protein
MFTQNREQLRQFFIDVWHKHQNQHPLEPLEAMVLEVILLHREYHRDLTDKRLASDFLPEHGQTNPFLHLGLHIALREQINTDRPNGIKAIYHSLLLTYSDAHTIEHQMMECLMEALWQSQRYQTLLDESAYLACLQQQVAKK